MTRIPVLLLDEISSYKFPKPWLFIIRKDEVGKNNDNNRENVS